MIGIAIFELQKLNDHDFSIYHVIYNQENIFLSYDWNESLENSIPNDGGYLLTKNGTAIGGISFNGKRLTAPYLIPPFCDKTEFWREVLKLLSCHESRFVFENIPASHLQVLKQLGAVITYGQRRMIRPTSKYNIQLNNPFYFDIPLEDDKGEIIRAVYEAHLHGYTNTVNKTTDFNEISNAINRRFISFSKTNTLNWGTIVKRQFSNQIIAVCLAGMYPDSHNNFSTIHQVSVIPEYRRQGLAKAMMLNSINKASEISPAITLGVMVGNPAELLYKELGFFPGCEYYNLILAK